MTVFEYKVIPAPSKGRKAQGVKGAAERFALSLQEAMNAHAADGWEYQRADILPSEERQGLTSSHTVYRSVLVFRRRLAAEATSEATAAEATATPPDEAPADARAADADTPHRPQEPAAADDTADETPR